MYIEVRSGCKIYVTSEHLQIGKDTIEVYQQRQVKEGMTFLCSYNYL